MVFVFYLRVWPRRSGLIQLTVTGGNGGPAIPGDKVEDKVEDERHDWEHDPVNPRNWSPAKKWITTTIVSLYNFVAPLATSVMAPGLPNLAIVLGITDPTVLAMTLSVVLLSYAIGPLFLAPLSEVYGRVWVLHLGNIFFLAFNLGCALSRNATTFIIFRFLAGFAGSAPIACGGGVVSDLFSERERASAMALYSLGPLIGPSIGPVMGGIIAQLVGIQYVFYVIVGICAAAAVLGIPLLRETYAPVIRLHLALDPEKAAAEHPDLTAHHTGKWAYLWINLKRPVILLTGSFVCFILSLYMAFRVNFLMFATFPAYHFSTEMGGLTYLGFGFGLLSAVVFGAKVSNKIYLHVQQDYLLPPFLLQKMEERVNQRMRVPALIIGSFFVPVGLLWYGWSAQAKVHWIMPVIGSAIFGFGLMTTFLPIQLYLVDSFYYAASALAAASTFRSLLGFAFPLFGEQMFAALGYGGGNSLLAGLAIVIGIPFPVWIYYTGERIRARSSLTR
ncbi:multidrug resistance protein 4 [Suillus lakei]|nr:multidrug resistance protein 4 [Suillus lakei]